MKSDALRSLLFAGLLLVATTAVASAQTDDQDHDAHHPQEKTEATPQPGVSDEPQTPAMPGGMPGAMGGTMGGMGGMGGMMGMMTPEMMQMMQGMMARQGAQAGEQPMMGPGMQARRHHGRLHGEDDFYGHPPHRGHHHGMMGGRGLGPELLYGMPQDAQWEMTPGKVRAFLERQLAWHGNPRLRIGEIGTAADGSITAEIVTQDGSLVQKLAFNRYPGLYRQLEE